MNEAELQKAEENRAIRGYIIRCLIKGHNNSALVRHISNALVFEGMIMSPDISKYISYLVDGGYIEFTNKKIKTYTVFAGDAVIRLTNKGVNLAEGAVTDPGVEM